MPKIFVAQEHSQIYDLWRLGGDRSLRLVHIDHHCDMRGLLVDRRRGRAFLIGAQRQRATIDSGNFLAHAIVDGIVSAVCWVHDDLGGRCYDVGGTVKFERDITALPHRVLHFVKREPEAPIRFDEAYFRDYDGPEPGQHLDIDWDGLAPIDYDLHRINALIDRFFEWNFKSTPPAVYLVYSPGYSHPDRRLFEAFLDALRRKFAADVVRLPAPAYPSEQARPLRFRARLRDQGIITLHRMGIY
jgi:hypothetical protein